jgi:hypothetical protein
MTVEGLKTIFDWFAVILLFVTFAAGVGVLITGNVINKRQEQQIRQFDKDLTGAKTELSKQQERAANADARVAGLERAAADAKAEMARQQSRAAEAERNLLELRQKVKSRHLSSEQAEKIAAFLLKAPPGSVEVQMSIGVEDGAPFCAELAITIAKGGWKAKCDTQTAIYQELRDIALIMNDLNSPPRSTKALQDALKQVNIQAPGYSDPSLGKDVLILLVAPRER